jgi:hypothetical protein
VGSASRPSPPPLSIWYLVRSLPLLVQGEVDATSFDIPARDIPARGARWTRLSKVRAGTISTCTASRPRRRRRW